MFRNLAIFGLVCVLAVAGSIALVAITLDLVTFGDVVVVVAQR